MRKIEPDLVAWIDKKLAGNGLAKLAVETKDSRMLFGLAAEACVGIVESGGNNSGPLVRLLQDTIGKPEKEPWCMAFVQSCLAYSELKIGVMSPIYPSEHCMTVWNSSPPDQRVKSSPLKYAIIIWKQDNSSAGHTGITLEVNPGQWFKSVEGNTGADGGRDGDGVYYKHRNWNRAGSLLRVGFLKPF